MPNPLASVAQNYLFCGLINIGFTLSWPDICRSIILSILVCLMNPFPNKILHPHSQGWGLCFHEHRGSSLCKPSVYFTHLGDTSFWTFSTPQQLIQWLFYDCIFKCSWQLSHRITYLFWPISGSQECLSSPMYLCLKFDL